MILADTETIFVHIARTGGSSIETALCGRDWFTLDPESKHISARQARNLYGDEVYERYFKFSFVRNPWDRLISMVSSYWSGSLASREYLSNTGGLKEIIQKLRPHPNEKYGSLLMSSVLDDDIDFIGRFENLAEDFDFVCRRIGLDGVCLPHVEKRKHLHYSAYFDEETAACVEEIWALDIQRFDYAFERRCDYDPSSLANLRRSMQNRRLKGLVQSKWRWLARPRFPFNLSRKSDSGSRATATEAETQSPNVGPE